MDVFILQVRGHSKSPQANTAILRPRANTTSLRPIPRNCNRANMKTSIYNIIVLLDFSFYIHLYLLVSRLRFPPQSVSDGRRMTINVCGRVHRGPVCVFLVFWPQIAIESFVLFHHIVLRYMCFTMMFQRLGREPLYESNKYL